MLGNNVAQITADSYVPEQLVHCVQAVSGRTATPCGKYVAYIQNSHATLVAYPPSFEAQQWCNKDGQNNDTLPLEDCIHELRPLCTDITVVAPFRPVEAPDSAISEKDWYWRIPLPCSTLKQKTRNRLGRALRQVRLTREDWSDDHAALVHQVQQTRPLRAGTHAVYSALRSYATCGKPGVLLSSARRSGCFSGTPERLEGFCIGDFSSLHTAFYMFAFRQCNAIPGTADILFSSLLEHALDSGHSYCNMGLGINDGIRFFKQRWGAQPYLPYVETSWKLAEDKAQSSRPLKRLLSFFHRSHI